ILVILMAVATWVVSAHSVFAYGNGGQEQVPAGSASNFDCDLGGMSVEVDREATPFRIEITAYPRAGSNPVLYFFERKNLVVGTPEDIDNPLSVELKNGSPLTVLVAFNPLADVGDGTIELRFFEEFDSDCTVRLTFLRE
ncbi:MAG: hypothetical protein AAFR84_15935, partial [Pseudomonadota bacterium]